MKRILIKNGMVVTGSGEQRQDILIEGGKIVRIGECGSISVGDDAEVMDVEGKYVLPGLIEPHMHIKAPLGGITDILDFDSASKCAAFGGVTTFMDFSSTLPGDALKDAVSARLLEMQQKSKQDYSIHCKVVNLVKKESLALRMLAEVELDKAKMENDDKMIADAKEKLEKAQNVVDVEVSTHLNEIPELIRDGIPTFKLFMTYRQANVMIDDVYMLQVMKAVKDAGGRCGFHAECNAIAEYNETVFREANTLRWEDFPRCKPHLCEEEAVRRVLYYAEMLQAPIYFFHISTKGAVEQIRAAKARGIDVIAETCSHYLMMTDEQNKGDDGILYLMSPPLRKKEDQEALWNGIADGTISIVTSDNCTFPRWMKEGRLEKKANRIVQDFTKVISGVSGIEERLGLLLSQVGRHEGFTLPALVKVTSENPAKVFGCYPEKGCIAVGSDADLAVIDLNDNGYRLTLDALHYPKQGDADMDPDKCLEYAIYGDFTAGGRIVHTIRRGEFLVKNGDYQGEHGVQPVANGRQIIRRLCLNGKQ